MALKLTGSTITDNSTDGDGGGGIFSNTDIPDTDPTNDPDTTTTITNSTISGNSSTLPGGGVLNNDGLTVIENSTITNNTAPNDEGSGVASYGDDPTITRTDVLSTMISANTNTDVDFVNDTTNTFVSKGYNLIGDGNATGAFNQTGVADPGLGALADNGGPTQTHALLTGRPAIDKGPPSTSCPPPDTDQRGVTRPQDGDADATPVCDIGSFELFKKGSTNQIAAVVTYDAATDIATLNPTNNLKRGATYKAVVTTKAKDEAGNRLDQDDSTAGLQQMKWFFEID